MLVPPVDAWRITDRGLGYIDLILAQVTTLRAKLAPYENIFKEHPALDPAGMKAPSPETAAKEDPADGEEKAQGGTL